jgi:hypothetical protein
LSTFNGAAALTSIGAPVEVASAAACVENCRVMGATVLKHLIYVKSDCIVRVAFCCLAAKSIWELHWEAKRRLPLLTMFLQTMFIIFK